MKPHKVKNRFRAPEGYIDPPGPWTPPNQELADKFINAGCLVRPVLPSLAPDQVDGPQAPLPPEAVADEPNDEKPKTGFLGRRKRKSKSKKR